VVVFEISCIAVISLVTVLNLRILLSLRYTGDQAARVVNAYSGKRGYLNLLLSGFLIGWSYNNDQFGFLFAFSIFVISTLSICIGYWYLYRETTEDEFDVHP